MIVICGAVGEWEYPLAVAALEAMGLHTIMDYIRRWQASIEEKLACHPIYELCIRAEQRPGTSHRMRWWDRGVANEPEE